MASEEWRQSWRVGVGPPLSEGSFMSPCNHQVLNSTIRSCYFVAVLRREASRVEGGRSGEECGNMRFQPLRGQTQNSKLS